MLYTSEVDIALLAYAPGVQILIDDVGHVVSVDQALPKSLPIGWYVYQVDTLEAAIAGGSSAAIGYAIEYVHDTHETGDFCIGGAGLLIDNGKIVSEQLYSEFNQGVAPVHCHDEVAADFSTQGMQDWLITLRHPRTAIGVTGDDELCMVVIDGRQEISDGLTLNELAQFMHNLGCTTALNLGGGCATLWINGAVMNHPSAGEERPVSEALCIM